MKRGDLILARAFQDQPLARCVWADDEDGIEIYLEENYVASEETEPFTVKVPRDVVYSFDPELYQQIESKFEEARRNGFDAESVSTLNAAWAKATPCHLGTPHFRHVPE